MLMHVPGYLLVDLTYGDVLLDEPGNLYGLVCLDPGDPLLHQVPALHVQVQGTVLRLHLSCGDDLGAQAEH